MTAIFENEQITLTGAVPSQAAADRVVDFAARYGLTSGTIVNNLTIGPDVPTSGGVRMIEFNSIHFNEGSEEVHSDHAQQLDRIVSVMNELPSSTVHVVSNSDQRGSSDENFETSERRGEAVVEYLASTGIDSSRITMEAAGESNLLSAEETEEAYSLNRRTDFVIFGLLEGADES